MNDEERFWAKVDWSGDCWLWAAGLDDKGYGQFRVGKKNVKAHIFAYEAINGTRPAGTVVRHTCHNSKCVRPTHLITGTQGDNVQDMLEADRGFSKMTNERVSTARNMARAGATLGEVTKFIGDSRDNVRNAVVGNTFKHLATPPAKFKNRDKYENKLTVEEIKEIKRALQQPYRGIGNFLAKKYGVQHSHISMIRHGHVHGDVSTDE